MNNFLIRFDSALVVQKKIFGFFVFFKLNIKHFYKMKKSVPVLMLTYILHSSWWVKFKSRSAVFSLISSDISQPRETNNKCCIFVTPVSINTAEIVYCSFRNEVLSQYKMESCRSCLTFNQIWISWKKKVSELKNIFLLINYFIKKEILISKFDNLYIKRCILKWSQKTQVIF